MVTAAHTLSYYAFERRLWHQFKDKLKGGEIDLVHRITPLSPTTPSLLAKWCHRINVPFLLGPLNGGLPWPRAFNQRRHAEHEWLSYLRAAHRLMPGYRATRKYAKAILIGSEQTWKQLPARYQKKAEYVPENGIDPVRLTKYRTHQATRPIRCAFVGRLVPYKGVDMLLEAALPLVQQGVLTLDIIGDGPERANLIERLRQAGDPGGVRMLGWIDQRSVSEHLCRCDVLAFPSIREFGGAVVLEAMAVGLVPVVVNYGGPGELVQEHNGYRLPLSHRSGLTQQLRATLGALATQPETIEKKSAAARDRAFRHFTWQAKAGQVRRIYDWVLGRATKPNFPMPIADEEPGDRALHPQPHLNVTARP